LRREVLVLILALLKMTIPAVEVVNQPRRVVSRNPKPSIHVKHRISWVLLQPNDLRQGELVISGQDENSRNSVTATEERTVRDYAI